MPDLLGSFKEIKAKEPGLYPRDIAKRLGVSELGLQLALDPANRLVDLALVDWSSGLRGLSAGKLVVRSDALVLEYTDLWEARADGLYCSAGRALFQADHLAFIAASGRLRASLQFYSASGQALAKLFHDDLMIVCEGWPRARAPDLPSTQNPSSALIGQADLRPRKCIEEAAATGRKLQCGLQFPGMDCALELGITRTMDARGWFNVLDEDFDLHLKEDLIAAVSEMDGGLTLQFVDGSNAFFK